MPATDDSSAQPCAPASRSPWPRRLLWLLLLAGALRAEATLALANLVFLLLLLGSGMAFPLDDVPSGVQSALELLPSTALADGLRAVLTAALGDDNKLRLRANTEEASRRSLFGAPTFMIGDEMFWGDDRMEDAITFAAENKAA